MKYFILSSIFAFHFMLGAQIAPSITQPPLAMSVIDHPVSTKNPEAQINFNKGLTYIFAFNHDLAFSFFQNAAKLDPTLAMAYWGMALALGQNINSDITQKNQLKCYQYIQKAIQLKNDAAANEIAYIQALSARYTNDLSTDFIQLRYRYREAMKKVVESYPEDLDAAALYAESILDLDPWNWWTNKGSPNPGTLEAIENLDFVLSRNPLHLGANHYYIHAWEESKTPERALMSANRLETLFNESGHLLHMPCHIFIPVGDYSSALKTSLNAIAADRAYIRENGLSSGTYPAHYLGHNLSILARVYMLMEDYDNAIKTAFDTANFVQPVLAKVPHLVNYTKTPIDIYLYFHKWKELLSYPFASNVPSLQAYFHYSRAKAYAELGDLSSAEREKMIMNTYQKRIAVSETIANTAATKVLELAATDLNATFARVKQNNDSAIALLRQAVEIQDGFNYDEPPAWYISMRIPLAAVLLEQKNYKEAESVLKEELKNLQRNGRALFGLFLSLKAQGRETDAFWVQREMISALQYSNYCLQSPGDM